MQTTSNSPYRVTTHRVTVELDGNSRYTRYNSFMCIDEDGNYFVIYNDQRIPHDFKAEMKEAVREHIARREEERRYNEEWAKKNAETVDWNKYRHDGQQSYDACQYWIEKWHNEHEARGDHWCGD